MNRRLFKNLNKNSIIRIFIALMLFYIVAMNIIYREGGDMIFYINCSPNRWLKTFKTFIKTLLVGSNFSTNKSNLQFILLYKVVRFR